MRQVARVLAVLTIGWFPLLVPAVAAGAATSAASVAAPAPDHSVSGHSVPLRAAPPSEEPLPAPELPLTGSEQSQQGPPIEDRRFVVGAAGAVLIALVLLVRKLRGKSYFGLNWRKRG